MHFISKELDRVLGRLDSETASAELLRGARKYKNGQERVVRVERALAPFRSLPFDHDAARHDGCEGF